MRWLTHLRLRRAVPAYVDGELDTLAARAVVAHLGRCWACSGEVELLRAVKRSLRNLVHRDIEGVSLG